MISEQITEIKNFMKCLLSGDTFDRFLFVEADIRMNISWHIDGRVNPAFFDTDALPERDFIFWEQIRPAIYSIIKGKELPLSMKIILGLPSETTDYLLKKSGTGLEASDFEGMYLNILFGSNGLLLTTGVAGKTFLLDRTPEHAFDDSIRQFLTKNGLIG